MIAPLLFDFLPHVIVAVCMLVIWRVLATSRLAKFDGIKNIASGLALIGAAIFVSFVAGAAISLVFGDSAEHFGGHVVAAFYVLLNVVGTVLIVVGTRRLARSPAVSEFSD
ncbi:MAG: hypothetical protein AAGH76_15010 [Pseudomonadota bacterium]